MHLLRADTTMLKKKLPTKRWKNHPQKLLHVFHNVAYRPTVYNTGRWAVHNFLYHDIYYFDDFHRAS